MNIDPNVIAQYGFIGVSCVALAYAFLRVGLLLVEVLKDGRKEARGDLAEERGARRSHESEITSLMAKLVEANAEQSRQMIAQRKAMEQMAESIKDLVEEVKQLKGLK